MSIIFRSVLGEPSGSIRDLKGYSSRQLLKLIEEHPQESRKEWILWTFESAGKKSSNIKQRQLWQQNNKPIEIWSTKVFEQKLNHIHNNPVAAGFMSDAVDRKYGSARNYANDCQTILEIDLS